MRGGRFASSTVDHLVEREHADAEYTRDCNYRLISFSMLLHVLLFVSSSIFFLSLATFSQFYFLLLCSFYSLLYHYWSELRWHFFALLYIYICAPLESKCGQRHIFFRSLVVIVLDGRESWKKRNFGCEYIFLFDAFHLWGKAWAISGARWISTCNPKGASDDVS